MEKILVISSYPTKKTTHGSQTVGVASYTKNTLSAIGKAQKKKISFKVLAEKLNGESGHTEGIVTVDRIWKRNSLTTFLNLGKAIIKEKEIKTVVIEFELSMFGTLIHLLPFPLFLLFLKLMSKKIILVCHQVIPNIEELGPHINISETQSITTLFMNAALILFYRMILLMSEKVIVFEEILKNRLVKYGNKKKIRVIPHGVESFSIKASKSEARKKLSLSNSSFVVLSFGFLAWYKGTDWLIQAVKHIKDNRKLKGKPVQLVLAGGANPNHLDKDYYNRYIGMIESECKKNDIVLTGFVSEKDIPLYFKASDLVVLPYRTLMSSSGPLSITFSFNKPFLLSPKLKGILSTGDMKNALKALKLSEEDVVFSDFNQDFKKKLQKIKNSTSLQTKLTKLSYMLQKERSWELVGRRYYEEISA